MVADIRLQCGERDITGVRLTIGLDLIRCTRRKGGRPLEVGHRAIELADGDVAVATVAKEARIRRKARGPVTEFGDGLAVAAEVREAPSHPDARISVAWRARQRQPRRGKVRFEAATHVLGLRRRDEGRAQERRRFARRLDEGHNYEHRCQAAQHHRYADCSRTG